MTNLILRTETYYLRRRVPTKYRLVEPRAMILQSLQTDSKTEAQRRALLLWQRLEQEWQNLLNASGSNIEERFNAAKMVAADRGYAFLPVEKVAQLPLPELLERMTAALDANGQVNPALSNAILGTAPRPKITLSRALELYWDYADHRTRGKSDDQIRRWRNPRIKAFKNLIKVVGDIALDQLTPDHMLQFREWWWIKINSEKLTPNSGNKDFTHIASTLREVNRLKRLNLTLPVGDLAFNEGEKRTRAPFTTQWIREKIIDPDALSGLNLEARCILLGMVNTGYRPSEAQGLRPEDIRLDTNLPHISIEPVDRTLKTSTSKRIIPLVGISLEAFRTCPNGFPRYKNKPGLSATVNKYLRERGLTPTPKHSLYGLRHSFQDRLLAQGVDDRIRRDLMGHSLIGERYGAGASLEQLTSAIQSIAL